MTTLPRALPIRHEETGDLLGWYPDRSVRDVLLSTHGGSRRLLLTKSVNGAVWLTGGDAPAFLSRLPDFVPREECYAMPEPTEGHPR